MANSSVLQLERSFHGSQRIYDILINGTPLKERLECYERINAAFFSGGVSPLGWIEGAKERLLLRVPADLPNERRSSLVCGRCGDLGCGAVCAVITRAGDRVVWEQLGIHDNLGTDPPHLFSRVTSFRFDWTQYQEAFRSMR